MRLSMATLRAVTNSERSQPPAGAQRPLIRAAKHIETVGDGLGQDVASAPPLAAGAVARVANDDRGIMPAEAKAVAHGEIELALPRREGRVIEIAGGIGVGQIARGRDQASIEG